MVVLNRIYTRTGDQGQTSLGSGERRPKWDLRIAAYGTVDETNASIGVARLSTRTESKLIDEMLGRVQNDLFDLGADLCTPDTGADLGYEPLRIVASQVTRLESEIDLLNRDLAPLRSFVLPGGTAGAAALHVSRTVCRRAERLVAELAAQEGEKVGEPALQYVNRLSDFLFVASRHLNLNAGGDVLWTPGANR
ncbi:MAG: cob(I)yrinic acid a,c-diamide adenosyltransferase [Beijerinckiaceae bacterium]